MVRKQHKKETCPDKKQGRRGQEIMLKDWLTKERIGIIALVAICATSLWSIIQARSFVTSEIEESRQVLTAETTSLTDMMTALEIKVDEIETSIITLQADLAKMETAIVSNKDNTNSQLSSLSSTLTGVRDKVNNISIDTQTIADTRADLDDLESDLSKLEKRVKKLEEFYGGEELIAYYNEDNGFLDSTPTWFPMKSSAWVGQQFTVDEVTYVRSVKLYLKLVEGSPTTVSVSLYYTNSSGLPIGSPWFKETFNPSNWAENDPKWYEFEVDNRRIDPDEKYVLILEDNNGSDSSMIAWGYDYKSGGYTDGAWVKSYDAGATWAVVDNGDSDGSFEIWGGVR